METNPIEVQKNLSRVSYPASRDELVEHARRQGAPDDVVSALQGLGDDSSSGPDQVMAGLG